MLIPRINCFAEPKNIMAESCTPPFPLPSFIVKKVHDFMVTYVTVWNRKFVHLRHPGLKYCKNKIECFSDLSQLSIESNIIPDLFYADLQTSGFFIFVLIIVVIPVYTWLLWWFTSMDITILNLNKKILDFGLGIYKKKYII